MSQILVVKHTIRGVQRYNRVRVEATDPAAAGPEILAILADTYQVDVADVVINSLGSDGMNNPPKPPEATEKPAKAKG